VFPSVGNRQGGKVIRKGQTVVATVVLVLALGLIVLPFSAARGAEDDIAKLIAEAKTASDHERIAAYYENEAKEAKANADRHKFEKHGLREKCRGNCDAAVYHEERLESLPKAHSGIHGGHGECDVSREVPPRRGGRSSV
jgi:hypothetical protein